jgi:hypothetical protein
MNLEIKSITVMLTGGTDKVFLDTDLPDGCWPYTGMAQFHADVAADHGVNWVKRVFGEEVNPRIIDTRVPKR